MSAGEEEHAHELSWAGRPLSELVRLAWPIAASMVSYSAMTLVDTLFLGWVGPASLAGVGLGGIAAWALICFPWGLLQGAKVLTSQAVGAGEQDQVGRFLGAALIWAAALGLVMSGLGLLVARHLPALAASEAAGGAARAYLGVRALGIPLVLVFCAAREVRQGLGDARTPMVASLAANLVNVGLDYLLIVRLGHGPAGAAWASVAASALEVTLILAVQQRREGLAVGGTRLRHLWALWRLGWPTGLQLLIEMGCFAVLTVMVSRYSVRHMAAHQITLQVLHFSFLPALALGEAAAVLAGQAVGARREGLVRRVARLSLLAGGVYMGACALLFGLGGATLAAGFSGDARLVELTARLLLIAAFFQVFDAANMIARCVLRGTGDVRFPAVVGTLLAWALTPPAMWLLGYQLGLGAVGGWLGLCAEIVVGAVIFWARLERQGWRAASARARAIRRAAAVACS
jgi:MATE family multidrug resistance protein